MIPSLLDYYKIIKSNHVNIIYSGPIWADGVEGIGTTIKKRLELEELSLPVSQAVFSVFVEQMNNMLMYSAETEHFDISEQKQMDVPSGLFLMGTREKAYFIQTGNVIKKTRVDFIKEKLDYINTLDKAGLRSYYKEQLKSGSMNPESRGAGLGLIEIARRINSGIEYSFEPFDDEHVFFVLYVEIG